MSPAGAEAVVLRNGDLLSAYAKVLTLDTAVARALVRETLALEMFGRVAPGWLGSKTAALACMRRIFQQHYRTRECGRGSRPDLLAGRRDGELGATLEPLGLDDRELLFLRFGADLATDDIARLMGRDPAAVAQRLAALQGRDACDLAFRRLGKAPDQRGGALAHAGTPA